MKEEVFKEKIHDWFELSYASYLVLPRSVLQSTPNKWQEKFVELLNELGEMFERIPTKGTYAVNLRDDTTGRFIKDPLCDYERGRRIIELKKKGGGE